MRFSRPKKCISNAGVGPTKFWGDVADGVRAPFIKDGRASLKPDHEMELEEMAIAAHLTRDDRRKLVHEMISWRAEVINADEAMQRGIKFIRAHAKVKTGQELA